MIGEKDYLCEDNLVAVYKYSLFAVHPATGRRVLAQSGCLPEDKRGASGRKPPALI
jgi:hypothetical protein